MDIDKDATYEATISTVGWLDVRTLLPGVKFPRIPGETKLFAEFVRWLHVEKIHSLRAGGGQSGPSFFHRAYSIADAVRIERWLEEHGIAVNYMVDKEPTNGSWAFDKDSKWVDDDPLNPMRVPPGYELLALDTPTQAGDIHWHPAWTKWLPLTSSEPTTARSINLPVARKS